MCHKVDISTGKINQGPSLLGWGDFFFFFSPFSLRVFFVKELTQQMEWRNADDPMILKYCK